MSEIIKYQEAEKVGTAMVASGYFKDATKASQAIVKVLAGAEMGIGPFAAMTGIHIIKGKPVLGANVLATLIKNDARYNYKVAELTSEVCAIEFFEHGEYVGTSKITIQELKAAGSQNLQKYPKNMLFARAISNGAKWHTPGIFGGAPVYTPDEFGLDVDEEGDVLEVEAVTVKPEPVEVVQEPEREVVHAWSNIVVSAIAKKLNTAMPHARNLLNMSQALPDTVSVPIAQLWVDEYLKVRNKGTENEQSADEAARAADNWYTLEGSQYKSN